MAQHILMDGETGDPKVRLKGNEHGAALVTLVDPTTGEPYAAGGGGTATGGLTDAELRASPLSVTAAAGTLTDRSGTVTTGGTAQQLMAANASRKGFSVQNVSAGDLWIRETGTAAAAQPSLKLTSGTYFETPAGYGSTGAVSIFGATTGQAFTAREW
jgi:hypothetical protein